MKNPIAGGSGVAGMEAVLPHPGTSRPSEMTRFLGDRSTPPALVFDRYRQFRDWAQAVLDPAARARGLSSCEMCQRRVTDLPTYGASPPGMSGPSGGG